MHSRKNTRLGRLASLLLVVTGLAVVPACQVGVNCNVTSQTWWGGVDSEGVQFTGFEGKTIDGTIFRPEDATAFPGQRPVVVVVHGFEEDECHQWWSAEALAGHGYIALTFTTNPQPQQTPDTEAAINWVLSSANPFLSQTDPNELGLLGHSAAGYAEEQVQASDPRVKAFVVFDNTTRMSNGCPDEPGVDPSSFVMPVRTPGLGIARDSDCTQVHNGDDPDSKLPGYQNMVDGGVPSGEVVLNNTRHVDFETTGNDSVHQTAFFLTKAWFDYWVVGDRTALGPIASATWNGVPQSTILSSYYHSAMSTPAYTCADLHHC